MGSVPFSQPFPRTFGCCTYFSDFTVVLDIVYLLALMPTCVKTHFQGMPKNNNGGFVIDTSTPETLERDFYAWLKVAILRFFYPIKQNHE